MVVGWIQNNEKNHYNLLHTLQAFKIISNTLKPSPLHYNHRSPAPLQYHHNHRFNVTMHSHRDFTFTNLPFNPLSLKPTSSRINIVARFLHHCKFTPTFLDSGRTQKCGSGWKTIWLCTFQTLPSG